MVYHVYYTNSLIQAPIHHDTPHYVADSAPFLDDFHINTPIKSHDIKSYSMV
jgi:hypothetical protein